MHLRPDSCHRLNLKESEITLEAAKSPASASHFMKCQINNDKWNFCECKSCRYKCETADVETGEKVIIYHQLNFLPIMILLAVTNNRVLCVCVYLWNKFVFISGWEADQFAPSEKELTKSTNLRQWCGSWSVDFKSDSSKYISINCSVSCYPLTSSNGRVKEKKNCAKIMEEGIPVYRSKFCWQPHHLKAGPNWQTIYTCVSSSEKSAPESSEMIKAIGQNEKKELKMRALITK